MNYYSIVLPVRNGWPLVRECVDSILAQTYPYFKLHILDNHSTDETIDWLDTLDDERIEVTRSGKDLSIVDSWSRITTIKKNQFMTLIGHDDILYPNFLLTINELIKNNKEAGLYYTSGHFINTKGEVLRSFKAVDAIETTVRYLERRFNFESDVSGTGYVMRSVDFDKVGGIPKFESLFFSDDALWILMTEGRYKAADSNELYAVRLHSNSESASNPSIWRKLVVSLEQFNHFLVDYIKRDEQTKNIYEKDAERFFLENFRNIYIYALVEASISNKRIDPDVILVIQKALLICAPKSSDQLGKTLKLKILVSLNSSQLRGFIPFFWGIYRALKEKLR